MTSPEKQSLTSPDDKGSGSKDSSAKAYSNKDGNSPGTGTSSGTLKRLSTQAKLNASQERSVQGISYKIDESHWMCTFVWDRDGQERKMLRYDLEKLVRVGGVLSMLCSGTVFTMDRQLVKATAVYLLVLAVVSASMSLGLNHEELVNYDTESLEQLSDHINGFVPFVLALYVSLVLSRWWALRVQALGNLFNAASNTVMIVSICLHTARWSKLRKQVVRLCMASIMLVVKAARKDDDLSSLIEQQLIDEREAKVLTLAAPFQRSTTMWIWILRLCETSFTIEKIPPPRFNALMAKAVQARDGVQTIHTYLDTQLPFAYVHLITLLVNIQNLVVALKCGVVFAVARETGDVQRMANQIIMATLVCVIYQGLLVISYVVHDPFGEDLLDFPVVAYTEYVAHSCNAVENASQNCPVLDPDNFAELLGVDEEVARDILNGNPGAVAIVNPAAAKAKAAPKAKSGGLAADSSNPASPVANGDPQRLQTAIAALATELQFAKGTEAAEDLVKELKNSNKAKSHVPTSGGDIAAGTERPKRKEENCADDSDDEDDDDDDDDDDEGGDVGGGFL